MSDQIPRVGTGAMILRDNKVLLGKRMASAGNEGTWTMSGGKLEYHETLENCAIRETKEETGLMINSIKLMCVLDNLADNSHFVTLGFFCTDFEGEPTVMEPHKITEWTWFDLNNLPTPLFPPSEKVIQNYQEKLFYKKGR